MLSLGQRIIFTIAIFVMPLVPVSFQSSDGDLFQTVPKHNRDEVRTSVNNLVRLYKQREWGKIYDLIENPQSPRDVYIRNSSNISWTLMEFTPRGVRTSPQSDLGWYVDGCADVIDHGKKAKWASIIEITSKGDKTYALFKIAAGKKPTPLSCEEAGENGY